MDAIGPLRNALLIGATALSMALTWRYRLQLLRLSINPHSRQFMALVFYVYWFALLAVQDIAPG